MGATKHQSKQNAIYEECPTCDRETSHSVSLQILTESNKTENAQFSREPYRVSKCQICGTETTLRMNNA
ncbi:DUF7835 family putative zinc beta-ribbon protein [Halocatena marina]|uniref:DUF7835 domain-containing protein n=1 Tax=Halocatena marina TaxID=2934937 RepID=A0ABD5YPW3_9EURY|nr:hypothetical protein [Halocatena marina]